MVSRSLYHRFGNGNQEVSNLAKLSMIPLIRDTIRTRN